jgi:hypothetical protein
LRKKNALLVAFALVAAVVVGAASSLLSYNLDTRSGYVSAPVAPPYTEPPPPPSTSLSDKLLLDAKDELVEKTLFELARLARDPMLTAEERLSQMADRLEWAIREWKDLR